MADDSRNFLDIAGTRYLVVEGAAPDVSAMDELFAQGVGLQVLESPSGVNNFEWLGASYSRLQHLSVTRPIGNWDISTVIRMRALRSLVFWPSAQQPLPVESLPELVSLAFNWKRLKIEALAPHANLRNLGIDQPPADIDLGELTPSQLDFTGARELRTLPTQVDTACIAKLSVHGPRHLSLENAALYRSLRELSLSSIRSITHAAALQHCESLRALTFEDCGALDQPSIIERLNLNRLYVIGRRLPISGEQLRRIGASGKVRDFWAPPRFMPSGVER